MALIQELHHARPILRIQGIVPQRQPFANLAELRAVSGVDPAKLELRKSRILFN